MMTKKKEDPWDDDPLDRDLSGLFDDGGQWQWAIVEAPKDSTVTLRLPSDLLKQVKAVAKKRGLRYQGLMRRFILEGTQREARR